METGQGQPGGFRARVLAACSQHAACIPAQSERPTREEGDGRLKNDLADEHLTPVESFIKMLESTSISPWPGSGAK